MKGCGPNLAKYMKKNKMKEPEHDLADEMEHLEPATDDFDLDVDSGTGSGQGKMSKKAKKGAKHYEKLKKG